MSMKMILEGNEVQFQELARLLSTHPILTHATTQIEDNLHNGPEEFTPIYLNETDAGDPLPDSLWEMR